MATIKQKLFHKCNCSFCEKSTPCLICGSFSEINRAHIIPQRVFAHLPESFPNRQEWLDMNGHNVMPLCKKHHREYDSFSLEEQEFNTISSILCNKIFEFDEFLGTNLVTRRFNKVFERYVIKHTNWIDSLYLIA